MADHVSTEYTLIHKDAVERALRTLWQGVGVDAAIAIGAGTLILVNETPVNSGLFWSSLGIMVTKSVIVAAASYLARLKITPKQSS